MAGRSGPTVGMSSGTAGISKTESSIPPWPGTTNILRTAPSTCRPVRTKCSSTTISAGSCSRSSSGASAEEEVGTFEDSMCAVILAGLMHDLGMMIGRQGHEEMSVTLAKPIIERAVMHIFPDDLHRRTIVKSVAIEAIIGHMASRKIHSIEAGIILIADGCDMTKGRARIPLAMNTTPKVGDIHKYSANAIDRIRIHHGENRPIKIDVAMTGEVGFFQIEEVLFTKISSSPAKQFVELYACVEGEEPKRYL